jgi:hypothetical protein
MLVSATGWVLNKGLFGIGETETTNVMTAILSV